MTKWNRSGSNTRIPPDRTEEERLHLYVKNFQNTEINPERLVAIGDVPIFQKTFYSYDLIRSFTHSTIKPKFAYEFGDVREIPSTPTFVKSRPISTENQYSCLLPLEMERHFQFFADPLEFEQKQPCVFWRGAAYQPWRRQFLEKAHKISGFDVGDTARKDSATNYVKPYATPLFQFKNKFLFSIEGNDVASNLKWALASNSVVMMPKPKFETWFAESRLVAGTHYVEVKDDYSDLEDQFRYYLDDPDLCLSIIQNAQEYVAPFKNRTRQYELGGMVIDQYAHQTCQG